MIEQAIYFALGCIVTALCALGFLPVLWSRALRLTRRRLQLQIPVSMQEILAERDQLRAEFAVDRLRIEQEMARVRDTKAADMAAIGRQSVQMHALAAKHDLLIGTAAEQATMLARLERENAEAGAEAGTLRQGINDAHALLERRSDELHKLTVEQDVSAAAFEASDHAWMAREETLRGRLDAAMAQARRHESNGLSVRREADELKARVRFLEQELTRVNEALDADRREGRLPATSRSKLEALELEIVSLRQALAAAATSPEALPNGNVSETKTDAELRASIHALGLAVAVMSREARDGQQPRPSLPRVAASAWGGARASAD